MKLDFIDATETEEMSQRGEFIESGTKTGRFLGIDVGAETIKIVEVVSGLPYEQFLAERLLIPLGMHDTTFRPTARQLQRLAKAYKPNAAGTALEEAPSPQLRYPLNDPTRCIQPAGGLLSTAGDLLNFYRMLLNDGVFDGRRILSAQAVRQMTTKQTGLLPQQYGFGFDTRAGKFGHGGTFGTSSSADRERGLITIFMIQYAGSPKEFDNRFTPAFRKAVAEKFPAAGLQK